MNAFVFIDNVFNKINKRKKQLIFLFFISAIFILANIWSLGSLISFVGVFFWYVEQAEQKFGINPYLVKAILVPFVALGIYSVGLSFSIISKKKRIIGRFLLCLLFTFIFILNYFYSESYYKSNDLFNKYTGEPIKRFSKQGTNVTFFPISTKFHPETGEELALVNRELITLINKNKDIIKSAEIKAKEIKENFLKGFVIDKRQIALKGSDGWSDDLFEVTQGDVIDISANGLVSCRNNDIPSITPNGIVSENLDGYNIIPNVGHCSLIAQILPSEQPIFLGNHKRFVSPITGSLRIGINDKHYSNNAGEFMVTVKRISN